MKKLLSLVLCLVLSVGMMAALTACNVENNDNGGNNNGNATYKIAVVTDVGSLEDKGFNEGTWNGAKRYAIDNNISYKYYQPANGDAATDNDRIAAMRQAVSNGAEIIVAPGFLQATAMTTVAVENPNVKFIFIDGWPLTDANGQALQNVTAVVYKEQESGFLAGYAAVMEGYTKLGFTGGGGGTNPACNRFGFGFVQGAQAAALVKDVNVDVKFSFLHGNNFSASAELQAQINGWYTTGTEVVFACGGSMFESVKAAAEGHEGAKIIGVDVDQSLLPGCSDLVITSAVKGLSESVYLALSQFYAGEWDEKLGGKAQNLGAAEDATGLPTETWSMTNFTLEQYNALYAQIKAGELVPAADVDYTNDDWTAAFTKLNISIEK
ncbi:MAG: BMP family ABC transporter substrate-binding protein [Clostridia bacterium]|nr:BMP family ABC transporter substrate-binding protein [Clostridia bacterium]